MVLSAKKSIRNRLILRLGLVILATVYSGVFLWIRSGGNSVCWHFKKYKGRGNPKLEFSSNCKKQQLLISVRIRECLVIFADWIRCKFCYCSDVITEWPDFCLNSSYSSNIDGL